jgi:phosphate transport system permease protein
MILFVQYFKVGQSALSGALALSMFNLPLMARLAEQALRAVPQDERSASLALGATKWQTIRHVVLPLAIPGVTTAIILTAGRAFGEAAVLIFTSGVSNLAAPYHYDFTNLDLTNPSSPWSPFHHATTLSTAIWSISTEGAEGNAFVSQILNGTAAILIATVLIFNLGARFLSRLLTRRLTAA